MSPVLGTLSLPCTLHYSSQIQFVPYSNSSSAAVGPICNLFMSSWPDSITSNSIHIIFTNTSWLLVAHCTAALCSKVRTLSNWVISEWFLTQNDWICNIEFFWRIFDLLLQFLYHLNIHQEKNGTILGGCMHSTKCRLVDICFHWPQFVMFCLCCTVNITGHIGTSVSGWEQRSAGVAQVQVLGFTGLCQVHFTVC